jgi:RNA-directed DNA polymerase
MVATLDVKNFFPSVRPGLVAKVFEQAGVIGDALPDAIVLTTLDEGLPQGAPTSCLLANLAFSSVDVQMIDLCRRRKLSYTRYVDDIAVSGNTSFQDLRGPFIDRIRSAGFEVADEKVHFLPAGERQVVTGLVVNAKLRPTKIFIEQLKNDIRLCVDRGPQMLAEIEGLSVRAVKSRLTGRATHVAMADPVLGRRLRGMLCGVAWSKSADAANGIFSSELAEATANL